MVREIDRAGLPIVHCCNLVNVAEGIGSNRILKGKSVLHALGDPTLPKDLEFKYREDMVEKALEMLEKTPEV